MTRRLLVALAAVWCVVFVMGRPAVNGATAPAGAADGERRTAQYFESIRQRPAEQLAFLLEMPKGGDLHSHLSGAIYAESLIGWAAAGGLCINQTFALVPPPCEPATALTPAASALTNQALYRQLVDSWSMRNWQNSRQSGHDHFFDTFGKFGLATNGQVGPMLAEVSTRAARGGVSYLELMITPDNGMAASAGQQAGWDGDAAATRDRLIAAGISRAADQARATMHAAEFERDRLLKCGTKDMDLGCAVTIRYLYQVLRGGTLPRVYGQILTGFLLASDPESHFVGLNLVEPEDNLLPMQNFSAEMQMLKFLRPLYPKAHLSLHAGELAPGLVPPDGLSFHIRDSVEIAGADRIGHGVDIMHETHAAELLADMAKRRVMVEICLTSNAGILGVSGRDYPLATYLRYGVPVALATDDEGVSRSEMSMEYLRAATDQGLGYITLKTMARTSLEHAFIGGDSLWLDVQRFQRVPACAGDTPGIMAPSAKCLAFLGDSERAQLQWDLERAFLTFEKRH